MLATIEGQFGSVEAVVSLIQPFEATNETIKDSRHKGRSGLGC